MKAEIISIGTELTSGSNLNTNSQWLSQRLAGMGIAVRWHTTLADDLEENVQAFKVAAGRAGLVLITGGLGPTQDDLTREALALTAGVELVHDAASEAHIKQLFERRGRTMPERNRVQALFPAGSTPIPNAMGTAPGIWMPVSDLTPQPPSPERRGGQGGTQPPSPERRGGQGGRGPAVLFIAVPGVPSEMYAMFEAEVKPHLVQWLASTGRTAGIIVQRKINCFGAGESAIEEKLMDLTQRGRAPEVGITASDATISLRILAQAANADAARQLIEPVERTIRERLGNLVFGVEDEELQHVVARLLREKRLTLSVAEGVTGGLLAHRLAQVPGVSRCFRGGVIAYDHDTKVHALAVPQHLLEQHGVVSAQVAEAMARACRIRFGTDLALSTVGIAGPGGVTADKPLGLVFVALAWKDEVKSLSFNWLGTRQEIQSRTAKMALNLARLHLLGT